MSSDIPQNYRDLFDKKAFAHLATLMPDGRPQVTPVWFEYDGRNLVVNTKIGRQKDLNMQRDKHVSLSIQDPDNPYRYLEVRGEIVERTEKGAEEHIDHLSHKYMGVDYPFRKAGEKRVIFKIKPTHTTSQ